MTVSAADDDGAAVEVMHWLYELSQNAGSKFVHYTSGGHGTEMFAAHQELPGTIVDWYVQTLVKTPGSAPAVSGASGKTRAPGILEEIDSAGGASTAAQKLSEARRRDPQAKLFSVTMGDLLGYHDLQP